jgi:hypothetical protein
MPRYFFSLATDDAFTPDDEGVEFPNLEAAYLDLYQTALEMSFEFLRERRDPNGFRFEITDASGAMILELPFSEVLRPKARAHPGADMVEARQRMRTQTSRQRGLSEDIASGLATARESLERARARLTAGRGAVAGGGPGARGSGAAAVRQPD